MKNSCARALVLRQNLALSGNQELPHRREELWGAELREHSTIDVIPRTDLEQHGRQYTSLKAPDPLIERLRYCEKFILYPRCFLAASCGGVYLLQHHLHFGIAKYSQSSGWQL